MRILLIHNKYKQEGGEDAVFEAEKGMLISKGHDVRVFYFDNDIIDSLTEKLKLSYRLIYNANSKRIIRDWIREFKPDIIHIHNFFYVASPSIFFAPVNEKIPVVVTLHNFRLICSGSLLMRNAQPCELCVHKIFPLEGIKYKCHRGSAIETAELTMAIGIHKLLKTWTNKVSIYISLTGFARNKFINSSLNLLPERIIVKPNSVEDFGVTGIQDREDYFLFIGRLSSEKGLEVLLKAFENKKIVIEVIGDGPLHEEASAISAYSPNIKMLGYCDRSFIISKLKQCCALIVPSVCYESLPTAVLEAFSTGTPVIISDIDNLNEIVTNNYNGLHFKTNDPKALYQVVEEFMINNAAYSHLYSNSRNTYLDNYAPEMNYQKLMSIYKRAMNNVF